MKHKHRIIIVNNHFGRKANEQKLNLAIAAYEHKGWILLNVRKKVLETLLFFRVPCGEYHE